MQRSKLKVLHSLFLLMNLQNILKLISNCYSGKPQKSDSS